MKLKDGVSLVGVQWQMFAAAIIVEAVYEHFGYDCIITAGSDGKHMQGSLHYRGLALDFRTMMILDADQPEVAKMVKEKLGESYDVVLEHDPDHLHVEYDPKEKHT